MTILAVEGQRFPLGETVATCGAMEALESSGDNIIPFLIRHATGDWGDLSDDDKQANEDALSNGERLVSAYQLSDGTRIWIITERDRSVTTVLLPDEY